MKRFFINFGVPALVIVLPLVLSGFYTPKYNIDADSHPKCPIDTPRVLEMQQTHNKDIMTITTDVNGKKETIVIPMAQHPHMPVPEPIPNWSGQPHVEMLPNADGDMNVIFVGQ